MTLSIFLNFDYRACSKTLTLLLKNYPESFQEDEDEEEKEEELEGIAA